VGAVPFLRPGWIRAWSQAFGRGRLEPVVQHRDNQLVGIVPLQIQRGVYSSPTNWHSPEFGPVTADGADSELVERVLDAGHRGRRVSLAFLGEAEDRLAAWRELAEGKGWRVLTRVIAQPAAIDLHDAADWEGYAASRSRNLRSDLRRCSRRLAESGSVSFFMYQNPGELLPELLEEGFRIEGLAWKAQRGTAIQSSPATERFYREVAGWAAGRGILRLAFLHCAGRAVAFEFAIEEGGVYWALKGGHDPTFNPCGPGKLLLRDTIKYAIDEGVRRFEMGPVEDYKRRWANSSRDLHLFQAFPPSPQGFAEWSAFRYGRPAAKAGVSRLRMFHGTS